MPRESVFQAEQLDGQEPEMDVPSVFKEHQGSLCGWSCVGKGSYQVSDKTQRKRGQSI